MSTSDASSDAVVPKNPVTPVSGHGRESDLPDSSTLTSLRLETATHAPMVVMIVNEYGAVVWCNEHCDDEAGYHARDLVDRDRRTLRRGAHNAAFYEDLWDTVRAGRVWQGRMVNRKSDGSLHCEQVTVCPLESRKSEPAYFAVYRRLISDKVQAERREHRLQSKLARTLVKVSDTLRGGIEVLADLADHQTRTFGKHAHRVAELSVAIAGALEGTPCDTDILKSGALLHDVGKVVESRYLTPTSDLRTRRFLHATLGADLLRPIPDIGGVSEIIRHHHEAFDGSGYPDGLAGTEIPIGARIVAVANTFDRLRSIRPRRHQDILLEMRLSAGQLLDPDILSALQQSIEVQLEGNILISLRDLRVGMLFAADVQSADGVLLCRAGTRVTPRLLDRLRKVYGQENMPDKLTIRLEDPTQSPA